MTNVYKQAIKEITKAHKFKIKDFHNDILTEIHAFQADLQEQPHVDTRVVNMFITSVVGYLRCCRKLANNELDSLATSLLQEDPTQELTKDNYNKVKLIVSEHHSELSNAVVEDIFDKVEFYTHTGKLKNRILLRKSITDVVKDTFDCDLLSLLEELDESVTTVETVSIDELKKENMRLKAMLDNIKTLVS